MAAVHSGVISLVCRNNFVNQGTLIHPFCHYYDMLMLWQNVFSDWSGRLLVNKFLVLLCFSHANAVANFILVGLSLLWWPKVSIFSFKNGSNSLCSHYSKCFRNQNFLPYWFHVNIVWLHFDKMKVVFGSFTLPVCLDLISWLGHICALIFSEQMTLIWIPVFYFGVHLLVMLSGDLDCCISLPR